MHQADKHPSASARCTERAVASARREAAACAVRSQTPRLRLFPEMRSAGGRLFHSSAHDAVSPSRSAEAPITTVALAPSYRAHYFPAHNIMCTIEPYRGQYVCVSNAPGSLDRSRRVCTHGARATRKSRRICAPGLLLPELLCVHGPDCIAYPALRHRGRRTRRRHTHVSTRVWGLDSPGRSDARAGSRRVGGGRRRRLKTVIELCSLSLKHN